MSSTRAMGGPCFDRRFGVDRTQEEVSRFEEKAHRYIQSLLGEKLSLLTSSRDIRIMDFLFTLSSSQFRVIGPELICWNWRNYWKEIVPC